jgi:hypothetical protein
VIEASASSPVPTGFGPKRSAGPARPSIPCGRRGKARKIVQEELGNVKNNNFIIMHVNNIDHINNFKI